MLQIGTYGSGGTIQNGGEIISNEINLENPSANGSTSIDLIGFPKHDMHKCVLHLNLYTLYSSLVDFS